MPEHLHVEKPFLDQLATLGWMVIDQSVGRLPKIFKVMRENSSPALEFESDDGRTHLLIRLPVHTKAMSQAEVGAQSGPSRDQVLILRNLAQDRGIAELMALLERSNRTKFRDQVLSPLVDAGLIEMAIPDKPQSSKQKYRLTAAGRALLEQHARSRDGTDV